MGNSISAYNSLPPRTGFFFLPPARINELIEDVQFLTSSPANDVVDDDSAISEFCAIVV